MEEPRQKATKPQGLRSNVFAFFFLLIWLYYRNKVRRIEVIEAPRSVWSTAAWKT